MPWMNIDILHDIAPDEEDPQLRQIRADEVERLRQEAEREHADKMFESHQEPARDSWVSRVQLSGYNRVRI